jgi:hypothetical protein
VTGRCNAQKIPGEFIVQQKILTGANRLFIIVSPVGNCVW